MSSLVHESLGDAPAGHVRLVLALNPPFYLQIPRNEIESLCLSPRKYLVFLGWCILGTAGDLARALNSAALELDGVLDDGGLYYYVVDGAICTDLQYAVDLEVIKQRTAVPSETTNTRNTFRDKLLARDQCCVFTGTSRGTGIHIIPYQRGSEWFQGIIANRPNEEENVDDLIDINDIRNGVFVMSAIHDWFDPRELVILKTPNRYLDRTDIPRADRPLNLRPGVVYPRGVRYTLQWLGEPDESMLLLTPNNIDAAFAQSTRKRKPSGLLLHYNYGAAAVKRWGHGVEALEAESNPARPAAPVPAPMGPPRTVHDRTVAIQKRDTTQFANEPDSTNVGTESQPGGSTQSKQWDEDDVMLYFWGNSKAATERYRKRQEEGTRYMEQWRRGLPVIH